jgi:hypothetical protein
VRFADARRELDALGWCCENATLTSPSGGFWFRQETLESEALAIYAPAARRVYSASAIRFGVAHELIPLLRVLCGDPSIATLDRHMALVRAELEDALLPHGMSFSSWDFGYASIRATARHPLEGLAAIECLTEQPPNVEIVALHWVDDRKSLIRCSRSTRFPRTSFSAPELRATAGLAIRFLLAPTNASDYRSTRLDTCALPQIDDNADDLGLEVLR